MTRHSLLGKLSVNQTGVEKRAMNSLIYLASSMYNPPSVPTFKSKQLHYISVSRFFNCTSKPF